VVADANPGAIWTGPAPADDSPLGQGLVTADVVAAHLAIDVSTVYKLATSGALPVVLIGRAKRFRVKDVLAFVENATRGGQSARVDRVQQLLGGARCRRSNDLEASRAKSVHREQVPGRLSPGRPEDN
jgi:excisionase family DNA binding protein